MTFGARRLRSLYLQAWLLGLHTQTPMSHLPKPQEQKVPESWDEEMNQLDEAMEAANMPPVPVSRLLAQVERLEQTKVPDEKLDDPNTQSRPAKLQSADVEIASLFEPEGANPEPQGVVETKSGRQAPYVPPPMRRYPVKVEETEDASGDQYEESFASQRETAQLREEIDELTGRFQSLEEQVQLVLKEREHLPSVLTSIRQDLNTQLTAFSDKLYSALEARSADSQITSTLSTIDEIRSEHSDQLRVAAGYLTAEPSQSSPLVHKGASLKGKGKYKPLK